MTTEHTRASFSIYERVAQGGGTLPVPSTGII